MELHLRSAVDLARATTSGELSAREVVEAHLRRIEEVNPTINAIVTLVGEKALAEAAAIDEHFASTGPSGPLHGLPVAHKDLIPTAGIRTTQGSPLFADDVPDVDGLVVTRARAAGAITIGKTNTPEFGAGSHTFNPVFGVTRNPADPSVSAGGSSGGAAAALAAGMVPLADGSDLGGSLRNPASFCGVVGLRPSPGRVPAWPTKLAWDSMGVEGPMARTVDDVALFLSALAGPDARVPVSILQAPEPFAPPLRPPDPATLRIAFSPTLGGLPVDSVVASATRAAVERLAAAGVEVTECDPPLSDADRVFEVLRAWRMEAVLGPLYDRSKESLKETVQWNIEEGILLNGSDVGRAEIDRSRLFAEMDAFLSGFDALVTVVSQVPPFPVEVEYPLDVEGVPMMTYIEWMRSCSRITVTSCPAISLPAGRTPDGLPVGMQLVTRYMTERRLLDISSTFEEILGTW